MKTPVLLSLFILGIFLCSCEQNNSKINQNNSTTLNSTDNPDSLSGKNSYSNPVDGNTYVTNEEWKEYKPKNERIDTGIVKVKQVILVTEQSKIPTLIGVQRLAEFLGKTDTIVQNAIGETKKEGELLVQITLTTNGPKVKVSARDDVDQEKVSAIFPEIEEMKEYKTPYDSLIFQTHYTINK